jgi:hypothetical protein
MLDPTLNCRAAVCGTTVQVRRALFRAYDGIVTGALSSRFHMRAAREGGDGAAAGRRLTEVGGSRDLKPFLRERNWADFDKLGYQKGVERLLVGLRRKGKRKRRGG